jgi:hypothetical protein
MRSFKYKGPVCVLGRFGQVKEGQTLLLTEMESVSVAGHPCFTVSRQARPQGFPASPGNPPQGPHYDLASLEWDTNRIFRDVGRLKRSRMTAAMKQLEASGYPIIDPSKASVEEMREFLLETGRHAGWR